MERSRAIAPAIATGDLPVLRSHGTHYLQWHPDRRLFGWVKGRSVAVGNVFYFEEVIAGTLLRKRVIFTRIEAHSHIEFAPTFWLMRLEGVNLKRIVEHQVQFNSAVST